MGAEEKNEEFPITFKKDKALKQMPHQFCFNSRQRKIRMQTIDRGLTIRAFDLLKMTNKRTIRILVNRVSVNKLPLKEANSKKRSTIIDSTLDDTQNRPTRYPNYSLRQLQIL